MVAKVEMLHPCYKITMDRQPTIEAEIAVSMLPRQDAWAWITIENGPATFQATGTYTKDGDAIVVQVECATYLFVLKMMLPQGWEHGGNADYSYVYNRDWHTAFNAKVTFTECE